MKAQILCGVVVIGAILTASLLIPGCTDSPVELVATPTEVGAVAFLMKNDKPFIMVNMAPESPHFARAGKQLKEAYLLKRAAEIILEHALARQDYEGMDAFVVRMVLLEGKDDYARPKWGNAVDLALLELRREAVTGLSKEALARLERHKLRDMFASIQFK